jgi:hypothetical protein
VKHGDLSSESVNGIIGSEILCRKATISLLPEKKEKKTPRAYICTWSKVFSFKKGVKTTQ